MKHFLSLGAGVQSSTMALMAAKGEITPMPDAAIFADTQAEPRVVYEWLDWLRGQLPFPVHVVSKGSLTETVTTLRKRKDGDGYWIESGIPAYTKGINSDGKIPRQCTQNFKVKVLIKTARRLAEIKRGEKEPKVTQWIGISLDETHRMKPPKDKWILHRWPLVDMRMRRHDCLLWMERNGYPNPPRSACVYCPYHSNQYWKWLKDTQPEDWDEAVRVDKEYRRLKVLAAGKINAMRSTPYVHKSLVPLDEADLSTDVDRGQEVMFGNECEGMCGV